MIQTQTIDIEHVRLVLLNCPHYDDIVNYDYSYNDVMTKKLIDWYRELVFSIDTKNENQLILINTIDNSLYLYIVDKKFRKKISNSISTDDLLFNDKDTVKMVVKNMIDTAYKYENEMVLEFSSSKWL